MKEIQDITAVVCDFGSFESLADKLSESYGTVYYHSPIEAEFKELAPCCKGVGLDRVIRLDDYMDPTVFNTVDLWIFPDIGYGGFQKYLRSIGKPVWGSMGASDLEEYRTRFLQVLKQIGLPTFKSVRIDGLSRLSDHLKKVSNKWVKVNRYRGDRETFKHIDYVHSVPILNELSVKWGPLADTIVFVVQDDIPTDIEIGYDGWLIDGQFPAESFQGYEAKNELYLGSLLKYDDLPNGVRQVNEVFAPVLAQYGYRNFIATEVREKDGVPYFIDPTNRMAGQTMEHQLETCTNIAKIILAGANGEIVQGEFNARFAAEATMHYTLDTGWKTIRVPNEARPWSKFYHYCIYDDAYHFPPHKTDEVGVVVGTGDTPTEAIDNLKEHFALFENEPLRIEVAGFVDLVSSIESAEEQGVEFSDQPLPEPAEIMSNGE